MLIVDAAGKKTATAAPAKKKGGGTDSVANDVKALKIDDTPLPKSKNLNVLDEFEKSKSKKTASFVVVGKSHCQFLSTPEKCANVSSSRPC
jgi:elongation factor 1 alpha-like protein